MRSQAPAPLVDLHLGALDPIGAARIRLDVRSTKEELAVAPERDGGLPALEGDFLLGADDHAPAVHTSFDGSGAMGSDGNRRRAPARPRPCGGRASEQIF